MGLHGGKMEKLEFGKREAIPNSPENYQCNCRAGMGI